METEQARIEINDANRIANKISNIMTLVTTKMMNAAGINTIVDIVQMIIVETIACIKIDSISIHD